MATQEEIKQLKSDLLEYRKGLNESIKTYCTGEEYIDFAWLKISLRGLFDCCGRIVDMLDKENN